MGGPAPRPPRGGDLDLQLTRLALDADNPAITADWAAPAVGALRQGPASAAAELGHHAIALLDRHHHPVPLALLRAVADAAVTSGDGERADTLLQRAVQQIQTSQQHTDPADHAAVLYDHASRLITRGETGQAETLLHQARQLFTDTGDARSAAVTWGRIAEILQRRGEVDEAVELQLKRLEVNEQLGDIDGIAVANWDLARIDLDRQDFQAAAPRLVTSFQLLRELQRQDGIAVVGIVLGQVLLAAGARAQARQVLQACRVAAAVIGAAGIVSQADEFMGTIGDEDEEDEES